MAKKTSAKTKNPAARAKTARPVRGSSKSSSSAGDTKYEQSGAPWWKAHLPPR